MPFSFLPDLFQLGYSRFNANLPIIKCSQISDFFFKNCVLAPCSEPSKLLSFLDLHRLFAFSIDASLQCWFLFLLDAFSYLSYISFTWDLYLYKALHRPSQQLRKWKRCYAIKLCRLPKRKLFFVTANQSCYVDAKDG